MADYKVTDTELTMIANAIRQKGGTSASLVFPSGFASAVSDIQVANLGSLSISENGTYLPTGGLDGFDSVVVDVQGGGITPTGSISISENGTYDVTSYASAIVDIAGGGAAVGFPVVGKLHEDMGGGYVTGSQYVYSATDLTLVDVWPVKSGCTYIGVLGSVVDNRFRAMFSTTEINGTSSVYGKQISEITTPYSYADTNKYTAPNDGYIAIGKTNTGVSGISCYLIDITSAPTMPE